MGGLSDKIGRRKVLIPAILGFSVLSGFSGLSHGNDEPADHSLP